MLGGGSAVKQPELRDAVDAIIAMSDDEWQHAKEDDLHFQVIKEHCPAWVWAEVERLGRADFSRWYA